MGQPAIIVHGGAWYIPDEKRALSIEGCREAASAAWACLVRGGSALDAVETAVRLLEDNPAYDAGRGSYYNRQGRVQLDAIIVDGHRLDFGSVAAVERVRHPITLARRVMERSAHRFVVGPGAEALAVDLGMTLCDPDELLGRPDAGLWAPPVFETEPRAEAG